MRTVIFIGLLTIAECINPAHMKESMDNGNVVAFISIILVVSMAMDVWEFIEKNTK